MVIAIENVRLFQELKDSLEQQTAMSDVLRVIAGSPTELQPVLDAVTEQPVKLAGAKRGHIRQYDGEFLHLVASTINNLLYSSSASALVPRDRSCVLRAKAYP